MKSGSTLTVLLALLVAGNIAIAQSSAEPKPASAATRASNRALSESLDWENRQDFTFVTRGFVAAGEGIVRDASGATVWDIRQFASQSLDATPPDTVNPSLWRQAQLNSVYGLFKVTDRIHQVRGYDLSNLSIIESDTGYIVVDPLITAEVAEAAMQLVFENLPRKPVVAVIYSHSHADHFGGVRGVISEEDVAAGRTRIFAPDGFMDFAVSENVLAGNVMTRRASYMFGSLLPKNPRGGVGVGLGKAISTGRVTLIEPTDIVTEAREERIIDGVRFVFMNTPFAEAPAELMFYLPDMQAFYASEEANGTLHNLYTLRGAEVRDALLWSHYLDDALQLIDDRTEVLFGGHHWPRWGYDNIADYLGKHRDTYRYIHDQTLRLANHGLTMTEIAEQLELPDDLARRWFNRGYYGSLNHNIKAVYNKYLGFFDGNPANLHRLPAVEAAGRYVEFMGGADALLDNARASFAAEDYRWVAEVVNHLVFAEPENAEARLLQADALEQMGYQAESGQWRNFYLTAVRELRHGVSNAATTRALSPDLVAGLSTESMFDYLAVRLNGPAAADKTLNLAFNFRDDATRYSVNVENGVLHYRRMPGNPPADVTLTLDRNGFAALMLAGTPAETLQNAGMLDIDGDRDVLLALLELLDEFDFWFNIVTP
jgi:alkyl sulfatase BDS1-like metallo-beta-lactamase superfamily hydrolase